MNWRAVYEAEVMPDGHLRVSMLRKEKGYRSGGSHPRPAKIAWGALQQIKNELLGAEVTCVEIFPAKSDLVDEGDFRHLWPVNKAILPGWSADAQSPTGFRKRRPVGGVS